MNQQVNNRFREYGVSFPSDIADRIKHRAKEQQLTEQQLIKNFVIVGLATVIEREPVAVEE
jgi:hypothetical protein